MRINVKASKVALRESPSAAKHPHRPRLPRSMADTRDEISKHPEAPTLRAALDQLEQVCGPLESLRADAKFVRGLIRRIDPTEHGLTHRAWRRTKKQIGEILRYCGLEKMPARFDVPLLESWKKLLASVPKRPYQVDTMRFARWCSMRGIEPSQVTQHHFDAFGEDLHETTRSDLARGRYLALCNAWERATDIFSQWPRVRPHHVLNRLWYTRDWSVYPKSLLREIDRLFKARRDCGADVLSPWRGPINAKTEDTKRGQLRRVLHALCELGWRSEELTSLRVVLTPSNIKAALDWLLDRSDKATTREIYNIAVELRGIVRHWIKLPARQSEKIHAELDAIVKSYDPKAPPVSLKTSMMILRFEDRVLRAGLLELAKRIFDRHASKDFLTRTESLEIQVAVAIELAIITGVDPTTLASFQLGRDILRSEVGSAAAYLATDPSQPGTVKARLPAHTLALLELYLARARLRLHPTCTNNSLFPGSKLESKHPNVLSRQIATLTKNECGIRITARHLASFLGFLHLKADPSKIEVVKDLFGHVSVGPVERKFDQLLKQAAYERHDQRLAGVRPLPSKPHREAAS